jgi:hypothetical protein
MAVGSLDRADDIDRFDSHQNFVVVTVAIGAKTGNGVDTITIQMEDKHDFILPCPQSGS